MLENLDVTSVTIKLPFRLNHVNCFIAEGADGWTIIDTGLHDLEAYNSWKPFLDSRKISDIIVTHHHPDHYGFAGGLQEMTGAKVFMSKIEHETASAIIKKERDETLKENYLNCGIPKKVVEDMTNTETSFNQMVSPHPQVSGHLKAGDKFQFGRYEYEIFDAPGHADGLITFFNKENSVLFSTDHILPKITPNISYHFYGESNPLEQYITSLREYKKLEAELVIPSHGKPFKNANKRIDEILKHHDERLVQIIDIVKVPSTVFDVCLKLFGENLTSHEMRFAIGETISHLEYLINRGECSKDIFKGIFQYQV
ncbi:MBL fold metallo-hydrolase [Bacillus dakarensis]|uniref:MBL fold metallo-hydrolase n=1 Tax=Robertmurraya dakarensis TaxID=1926278 RepID=UPI000982592F|nr:MBL fold metallo-hydrolase [Bacillus dakarensis]